MSLPEENNKNKFEHLERLLTVKQLQINSLLEVSQAINNNFSTSALFRIYEFILRAQMGIQKLVVYIYNQEWLCVSNYGVSEESCLLNVEKDLFYFRQMSLLEKQENKKLSEFEIVIPVFHKDRPLAYVLIGNMKNDETESVEQKIKFIQTITNIVMVAVENKKLFNNQLQQEIFKKELELAARMQMMLIPSDEDLPNNKTVETSAVYLPHQDIGGDYFDCIEASDNELVFCIGDISGKGVAAALLMANFQANLRSLVAEKKDTVQFINDLNDRVSKTTKGEKFITFFLGFYDFKSRMLTYVNAGHNPSILCQDGEIKELKDGCTLLGMFDELPFVNVGRVMMKKNAFLFNYTDGLIDFQNKEGEFFGEKRVYEFIDKYNQLTMGDFNEKLLKEVSIFKEDAEFIDDITMLSLRFL
ncbi:MAG: SpoIIE family protein phosphatase [Chitinophagales bacterium]